jgi:single-strand DNA-binding protein
MNEAQITLQGWLGADPAYETKDGVSRCKFRVATTPRRYDKESGTWVDGDTQWYSVIAWRGLADNCSASLKRADPVVVHGRIKAEVWSNRVGIEVTTFEVEAVMVGHDLTRGTSSFARTPGQGSPVDASPAQVAGPAPSLEGQEAGSRAAA